MIRLSPTAPLASLAEALDMSPDRIALARPVARQVQQRAHARGDHVTVRVLRESVEATGRELVLLAVAPDLRGRPEDEYGKVLGSCALHDAGPFERPAYHQDRIDRAEREGRGLCEVDCNECGVRADQGPCRQEGDI